MALAAKPTEPKPLPRSLAAEGKAEPGAAENEQLYTESRVATRLLLKYNIRIRF